MPTETVSSETVSSEMKSIRSAKRSTWLLALVFAIVSIFADNNDTYIIIAEIFIATAFILEGLASLCRAVEKRKDW